jgi:hypothetical protein
MRNLIAGLMLTAATTPAFAQTEMTPDVAIAAAQNQLVVLEYCQTNGHIDETAVATQTRILEMMPPVTDKAMVEEAYEKGKAGTVSAMGMEQTLEAAATAQSTDEATLCSQMATLLEQAAAQLPE